MQYGGLDEEGKFGITGAGGSFENFTIAEQADIDSCLMKVNSWRVCARGIWRIVRFPQNILDY